jgi:fructose 1,6-bisphosphatase
MKTPADVYRAEILRAVLGERANESRVANIERLNQIAAHLVDCEDAKMILRAKGYGAAGQTFVELARSLPENVRGMLRELFRSQRLRAATSPAARYPDQGEVHDIWSAR